jgi:hypothetical protein
MILINVKCCFGKLSVVLCDVPMVPERRILFYSGMIYAHEIEHRLQSCRRNPRIASSTDYALQYRRENLNLN